MTNLLDGKELAEKIKKDLSEKIEENKYSPALAAVWIGGNHHSKKYIELKDKDCSEVGIDFENFKLPPKATLSEVKNLINDLNQKDRFDGIIVQLPAPAHLDEKEIINTISPEKDVDGLNPYNVGKLWTGDYELERNLIPCTPKGIMRLLIEYEIEPAGKHAVIINRTNLVGNPITKLLLDRDATVTVCHSKTKDIAKHTAKADILITAVGERPEFIVTEEMIENKPVVIDVGMNYIDGKLCGDVKFKDVKEKSSYITPVPGGVGPMTRVVLLENVLVASEEVFF